MNVSPVFSRRLGELSRASDAAWIAGLSTGLALTVLAAIGAGVTVGFYEYFAYRAGWWKYAPAHVMIGSFCAAFIPLGEAFMFLTILPVAARSLGREDRPVASAVVSGALFAAAIFCGYALAYLMLEAGRMPQPL